MPSDLHTLAYFSRNTIDAPDCEFDAAIADILRSSRANNRKVAITGALLFTGGCFAQVLEGPLPEVETVFERIQCDSRHSDITILHFRPLDERCFPGWSMAYAGLTDPITAPPAIEDLMTPDRIAGCQARLDLVAVLRDLIHRHDTACR